VANWNQPQFSPVTIAIETVDGQQVHAETFTPSSNIGNAASNDFSGTRMLSFYFDVLEKGRYVITFYTADAAWADLVLGQAALRYNGELSGITNPHAQPVDKPCYNLMGQRVDKQSVRGICVMNGKKILKK
jgi:hypothetical protein